MISLYMEHVLMLWPLCVCTQVKLLFFFPSLSLCLCLFIRMMKMTAVKRGERTSVQWKLDSVIGVASTSPIPS